MNDRPSTRPAVRRVDLTGKDRQLRSAIQAVTRIVAAFARASRRSMPFLARYRATVVPGAVESLGSATEAASTPGEIVFRMSLASADGSAWSTLTLNAEAIALVLEGALGGRGTISGPVDSELTVAQRALLSRIVSSLVSDLAACIFAEVGITMVATEEIPAAAQTARAGEVLRVECAVEGLSIPALLIVAFSAQALETAAREQQADEPPVQGDPRMAEALGGVPIALVAELGRVTMGLRSIMALRVGDVVRLPTVTDDLLHVGVGGVEKFSAVPVVSRGQLAIEIRARAGEPRHED
ncbi:MAG: FliM/FliN family flagellar motor switch protein [Myxococcales bacterium]